MLLLLTGLAAAQSEPALPALNAQAYQPVFDARGLLWTTGSGATDADTPTVSVITHGVDEVLVTVAPDGTRRAILDTAVMTNIQGAYASGPIRFGVDIPTILWTSSDVLPSEAGLGDVNAELRGTMLDHRSAPLGLGLAAGVWLPTATVQAPLGDDGVGWDLRLLADKAWDRVYLAGNIGTRGRPTAQIVGVGTQDDQLIYRAGLGWLLGDDTALTGELAGHATYGLLQEPIGRPLEGMLGGWHHLGAGWTLKAGAGTALIQGIGAPRWRALLGLSWSPEEDAQGSHGDGSTRGDQGCAPGAASPRGGTDPGGCPQDLETRWVAGLALPTSADDDQDTIPGFRDLCPAEPEDPDGFQDTDGCPEADNDGDGVDDPADSCPLVAETINGFEDDDGCPDQVPDRMASVVGVVDGIQFESGSTTLLPASVQVLETVHRALQRYTALDVRIEGHTDDRESPEQALSLSEARAKAVARWLEAHSIAPDRLTAVGYGPTRPVASNDTEDGRVVNRRVELIYNRRQPEEPQ